MIFPTAEIISQPLLKLFSFLKKIPIYWKQVSCSSRDEWVKKVFYIYIMENCSAIKTEVIKLANNGWNHPE